MNSVHIGDRLLQLRAMMAAESLVPDDWPRTLLARETGVPLAALTRLEKTGRGSTEVLTAVLRFYQDRGVNLAWVLAPDNTDIPMHGFRDIFQDEKIPQAREPLANLHQLLQPVQAELGAGQLLTPESLRSLLTQVQQGILHALKHLLPPRRLVLSEVDLRAYQRLLPPVRAQSAGWRSASLYTVPYHYYGAGESLPRCGDAISYLAYDPGVKEVSTSGKCARCQLEVDKLLASSARPKVPTAVPH